VGLGERPGHVGDAPAGQTGEVVVLAQVAVEARVRSGQLLDQSLGDEEPQVSIHGAKAHARQPAPHHLVHRLGGGMSVAPADHLQHQPARTGQPEADAAQGRRRPVPPPRNQALIRNDCHDPLSGMLGARTAAVKRQMTRPAQQE
jgi:hypothetical protein